MLKSGGLLPGPFAGTVMGEGFPITRLLYHCSMTLSRSAGVHGLNWHVCGFQQPNLTRIRIVSMLWIGGDHVIANNQP